jgi:hypothetical protein
MNQVKASRFQIDALINEQKQDKERYGKIKKWIFAGGFAVGLTTGLVVEILQVVKLIIVGA